MKKVYQPIVKEHVEELILGLTEAKFFEDYEINDLTFTRQHLSDIFTEKFILGELDDIDTDFFDEDQFDTLLRELVAGSLLYELKDKKYVNSIEDLDGEEVFFLTEDGKTYLKSLGD